MTRREALLFAALGGVMLAVFAAFGSAFGLRMLAEAACYAIIALGLAMQWGYAGLFNVGVMGFVALGGFGLLLVSGPADEGFRASGLYGALALAALTPALGGALAWAAATRGPRLGLLQSVARTAAALIALGAAVATIAAFAPLVEAVERGGASTRGYVGGLGLPAVVGWAAGGGLAALAAWGVAKVCLGLRSDYLAIATLGVAEIMRALLKNEDWLTRGTLTVSPLPWPTPTPLALSETAPDYAFELARLGHLAATLVVIGLVFVLIERAYRAPWGRMIRAIRDNETAAAAMGKEVEARRLEIFVLGAGLMGLGGAALVGFSQIFDPSGFQPLQHTFLIWVMVIVGGAGNNRGALWGALAVYILWILSEPAALALFEAIAQVGDAWFGWVAPSDFSSRALQMRVFVIGLTIALALRYLPRGVLPERPPRPF